MNASNPASYSLFTLWREIMSLFEATGHIGLPYLYLGCGFAKKALFFYFSSFLLCDAESTTTDNIVFRKPTSPPLALRKAFFESLLVNSLYDPFGSPCRGQKPQGRRGNRPTRCRFFESLRLPFQRELHLFPQAPSSSEGGGCNRSSSELKPLRYKVGGPSEVCARFLCGMGPPC